MHTLRGVLLQAVENSFAVPRVEEVGKLTLVREVREKEGASMNRRSDAGWLSRITPAVVSWAAAGCLAVAVVGGGTRALAQASAGGRPSTSGHVPELASYLDEVQIAEPVGYRGLAVYPVLLRDGAGLRGGWLPLDAAIARGALVVTEKAGGGSVPVVTVENRSRSHHIFIMGGEVVSGGKQTRTVRKDVVLAPGQQIELDVFCVEARRWRGGKQLAAGNALLPQSIQKELRKGANQRKIWSEVARNNAALGAENATGSLELALKAKPVQDQLGEVRRSLVPKMPRGSVGFIFVDRGRALGAELFGRGELARALLPKLLDSYAVDCVLIRKRGAAARTDRHNAAIKLFRRVCRAGSKRGETPGSGAGIRTRGGGLLGDGVSLGGVVVHYGVQIQDRIVPLPKPRPLVPDRQPRPRIPREPSYRR